MVIIYNIIGDIMEKYHIFEIKKENFEIYKNNPQSLYKTLFNLYNMNKDPNIFGYKVYKPFEINQEKIIESIIDNNEIGETLYDFLSKNNYYSEPNLLPKQNNLIPSLFQLVSTFLIPFLYHLFFHKKVVGCRYLRRKCVSLHLRTEVMPMESPENVWL